MTTTETLAERLNDLSADMDNVDPSALDEETNAALRRLRGRLGHVLGLRQDSKVYAAMAAKDLEDPRSRRHAEALWRTFIRGVPWRGKIVRRADASLTVTAKTYTDHGTVVVYSATVPGAAALVEAVEAKLGPHRTREEAS